MFCIAFSWEVLRRPVFQEPAKKPQAMQVHIMSLKNFFLLWRTKKKVSIKKKNEDANVSFFGHIIRVQNLFILVKKYSISEFFWENLRCLWKA